MKKKKKSSDYSERLNNGIKNVILYSYIYAEIWWEKYCIISCRCTKQCLRAEGPVEYTTGQFLYKTELQLFLQMWQKEGKMAMGSLKISCNNVPCLFSFYMTFSLLWCCGQLLTWEIQVMTLVDSTCTYKENSLNSKS